MSPQGGRKHPQQEFIQIDTTNILFICGGAFDGLDKYILRRTDKSALGFGSALKDNSSEAEKALLRKVEPHDLVKFGLIPSLSAVCRSSPCWTTWTRMRWCAC